MYHSNYNLQLETVTEREGDDRMGCASDGVSVNYDLFHSDFLPITSLLRCELPAVNSVSNYSIFVCPWTGRSFLSISNTLLISASRNFPTCDRVHSCLTRSNHSNSVNELTDNVVASITTTTT